MSYSWRARKKKMKRDLDLIDPDRKNTRNNIKRGIVPRFTNLHRRDENGRWLTGWLRVKAPLPKICYMKFQSFVKFTTFVIEKGIRT